MSRQRPGQCIEVYQVYLSWTTFRVYLLNLMIKDAIFADLEQAAAMAVQYW